MWLLILKGFSRGFFVCFFFINLSDCCTVKIKNALSPRHWPLFQHCSCGQCLPGLWFTSSCAVSSAPLQPISGYIPYPWHIDLRAIHFRAVMSRQWHMTAEATGSKQNGRRRRQLQRCKGRGEYAFVFLIVTVQQGFSGFMCIKLIHCIKETLYNF